MKVEKMKISVSVKNLIVKKTQTMKELVIIIVGVDFRYCYSRRNELRPFLVEKQDLSPAFTYASFDLKEVDPN